MEKHSPNLGTMLSYYFSVNEGTSTDANLARDARRISARRDVPSSVQTPATRERNMRELRLKGFDFVTFVHV